MYLVDIYVLCNTHCPYPSTYICTNLHPAHLFPTFGTPADVFYKASLHPPTTFASITTAPQSTSWYPLPLVLSLQLNLTCEPHHISTTMATPMVTFTSTPVKWDLVSNAISLQWSDSVQPEFLSYYERGVVTLNGSSRTITIAFANQGPRRYRLVGSSVSLQPGSTPYVITGECLTRHLT